GAGDVVLGDAGDERVDVSGVVVADVDEVGGEVGPGEQSLHVDVTGDLLEAVRDEGEAGVQRVRVGDVRVRDGRQPVAGAHRVEGADAVGVGAAHVAGDEVLAEAGVAEQQVADAADRVDVHGLRGVVRVALEDRVDGGRVVAVEVNPIRGEEGRVE